MKLSKLCLALLLFFIFVNIAYAQDVDLTDFPTQLADRLSITVNQAELLTGLLFLSFFLFPTLLLMRGKGNTASGIAAVFVGAGTLGFCVLMGWYPVWLLIIMVLIIALFFAKQIVE